MPFKAEVTGLKEFRRELKALGTGLEKDLQKTNKKVAADIVVPEAKRLAGQTHSNLAGGTFHPGSKGIASIRATASGTRAQVAEGGAKVPYMGGADWGSGGTYPQFPPKSSEGYILYPSVNNKASEIVEAYGDALDELASKAFPD